MQTSKELTKQLQQPFEQVIQHIASAAEISLEPFLNGKVYWANPALQQGYTEEEIAQIKLDLQTIESEFFANKKPQPAPEYIATAGAPGTGKTYFLENILPVNRATYIYVAPDALVLRRLTGYKKDIASGIDMEKAYTKWRDASNYIANHMLVRAISERLNIIHDTTSSSPRMNKIYLELHNHGYAINLHILFAIAEYRSHSINFRNKTFIQITPEDAKTKGTWVIDRLIDCYPYHAASIRMYLQIGDFWLGNGQLQEVGCFYRARHQIILSESVEMRQMFWEQLLQDANDAKRRSMLSEKIMSENKSGSLLMFSAYTNTPLLADESATEPKQRRLSAANACCIL